MANEIPLDNLKSVALQRMDAAERAAWSWLLEVIRQDLGTDLSQYLDSEYGYSAPPHLPFAFPWRLTLCWVAVPLRVPECSEILVQYKRPGDQRTNRVLDYRDWSWKPESWRTDSGRNRLQLGKFGVVRYTLNHARKDEARVEPMSSSEWYASDDFENARIVAAEFGTERRKLEEEAREMVEKAREDLRNLTSR